MKITRTVEVLQRAGNASGIFSSRARECIQFGEQPIVARGFCLSFAVGACIAQAMFLLVGGLGLCASLRRDGLALDAREEGGTVVRRGMSNASDTECL